MAIFAVIDYKNSIPDSLVNAQLAQQRGSCLQGARLKDGMSQVELAKKLGIPQPNVSAMELGKRPIGKKMAKRIAQVLKVDYRIFL